MRIGFESAGGRCVFSSEWDIHAQRTYSHNFGESPCGDITKIPSREIPKFDVLLAGFPCQPFSSIGRREGFSHETQGTLFDDILRILDEKRPSAFLLENVEGLETHDNGNTIRVIMDALEKKYVVQRRLLDSADFGVPQRRRRTYIIGFLRTKFGRDFPMHWPEGSGETADIGDHIEQNVQNHSISKHLQKVYLFKTADGRPEIVSRDTRGPVKTLCASYHKIQRLTGTFVKDGATGYRLLTKAECRAIMGFPKWFEVPDSVSRTQMYRQFGNSVAVPVIKELANAMARAMRRGQLNPSRCVKRPANTKSRRQLSRRDRSAA